MNTILILSAEENNHFIHGVKSMLSKLGVDFTLITDICEAKEKHFEYVILNSTEKAKKISINSSFCFINMDQRQGDNIDVYGNMITYGLGSKNTVTLSSMDKEKGELVYCLQRYININAPSMLEPQEIPIRAQTCSDVEAYAFLVSVTIALMENIKSSDIENIFNKKVFNNI